LKYNGRNLHLSSSVCCSWIASSFLQAMYILLKAMIEDSFLMR